MGHHVTTNLYVDSALAYNRFIDLGAQTANGGSVILSDRLASLLLDSVIARLYSARVFLLGECRNQCLDALDDRLLALGF